MSDAFDPYHKWLGIPPDEQPPDHYRLLGVARFEQDADVIDAAANQRMAYLQDMATGQYTDQSQALLNEISVARRCLLNPQARSEYDATLQPAGSGFPIIETAVSDRASRGVSEEPRTKPQAEAAPPGRGISPLMMISAASVGLVTLVVALVIVFQGGEEKTDTATLKVRWKLDEREGAYMTIDSRIVIDSEKKKLRNTEVVSFQVEPGDRRFTFERTGYRTIRFSHRFLPDEEKAIELNWRR